MSHTVATQLVNNVLVHARVRYYMKDDKRLLRGVVTYLSLANSPTTVSSTPVRRYTHRKNLRGRKQTKIINRLLKIFKAFLLIQ